MVMEAFPPVACEEAFMECEPPHDVVRKAVVRSRAKARIDFKGISSTESKRVSSSPFWPYSAMRRGQIP
jgi:hypothetical protein